VRFTTLDAWLNYLEQQHPKSIDLGLERVQSVASRLVISGFNAAVVTVAGTNGKGSFVRSLECLLSDAGLKVASYTSPHILRFNERIAINQTPVSDEQLLTAFAAVDAALEDTSLTYFEFTTLAAFVLFKQQEQNLDVIILEIGLGGRLDAVNIIAPDWAVLSSIAMDHQDFLGDSLDGIAKEKLGILREDTPLVSVLEGEALSLPSVQAALRNRKVLQLGQDFTLELKGRCWSLSIGESHYQQLPDNGLSIKSQAAAVVLANQLLDKPLSPEQVARSFTDIQLPGRFQHFQAEGVDYFLDVAHNPEAVALLCQRLQAFPLADGAKRLAVFTLFNNKDADAVIGLMKAEFNAWFLAESDNNRVTEARVLAEKIHQQGIHMISVSKNLKQAFARVRMLAEAGDQVVLFGSFEIAAELLSKLESLQSQK
jgi:dihydrofolate synthase/folylpolyglutamate synthase